MATVSGAVKQAGGYIWVYSEPGNGTTFKIYLPRVDESEGALDTPTPTAAAAVTSGHETILLVEDEEGVRMLTQLILERAGYRVIVAANAEEAEGIHQQFAGSIALLITDVVLPGPSGPELFRRLATRDPGLKVIYMSGYTDDAVFRTDRLERGMAFVQKPFTADALKSKLREVLEG